jgi:hypothetical protein
MMKKILLYIILLLPALYVHSQDIFVSPPAKLITTMPFQQLTGGVIMLHGKLDNYSDTLHFILDTGSAGISLDSETVDRMQLPITPTDRMVKGIGGIKNVSFTNNHTLKLKGLQAENLNFHINDYDILSSVYGVKVDGIIGYSFLIRYIVAVDFDSLQIKVYEPGEFQYPRGGYLLNITFSGLPSYPVVIKNNKSNAGKFYLDTGAGLNLLMSKAYYDDSAMGGVNAKKFLTQAEGIGGKAQMYLTTMKQLRLGPYRFRRVPAYIFNDEFNVTSYPTICGLIGNDILRRFNLIINYRQQEIHLSPNSHFAEPFDYAYTGLSIYYEKGNVIVEDIIKNSPAEKAGFKSGDIIFGVGNYVGNNMQTIKDKLQVAGERVKVLIIRDGKLDVLNMDVGSILR